jgi:hypothetical protein
LHSPEVLCCVITGYNCVALCEHYTTDHSVEKSRANSLHMVQIPLIHAAQLYPCYSLSLPCSTKCAEQRVCPSNTAPLSISEVLNTHSIFELLRPICPHPNISHVLYTFLLIEAYSNTSSCCSIFVPAVMCAIQYVI